MKNPLFTTKCIIVCLLLVLSCGVRLISSSKCGYTFNYSECQTLCRNKRGCQYLTWVTADHSCYLKGDNSFEQVVKSGYTSGDVDGEFVYENLDFEGADLC